MSEVLFPYYDRELVFLRQLAQEFAVQYPLAAQRLLLDPQGISVDPHVERLLEGVALLTARVHHKLDDEFPELTEALLQVLYPHYLAPIPSMAILQFEGNTQVPPTGFRIERHGPLHTQPVGPTRLSCRYRTGYPVTLWPVAVAGARLQPPPFPANFRPPAGAVAALRLQLECVGALRFAELSLDTLRFYLSGDNPIIAALYEMLFNQVIQVVVRPLERDSPGEPLVLTPQECIRPVGFERDEGLLPYPNVSFLGYRLLTEFFTFPAKFQFLDLTGLRRICQPGFGRKVEVVFFVNRTHQNLEQAIDGKTFRLNCTPVVNLFDRTAEPISLTQTRYEYRVVPDVAHPLGMEVYSVDSVTNTDPTTGLTKEFQPFYSFRHGSDRGRSRAFWYASRKPRFMAADVNGAQGPNASGDVEGTDIWLHLVDLDFDPKLPAEAVLVVRATCTNRDLPAQLQRSGEHLSFELEAAAPLTGIQCLRLPTVPLRPPLRRGHYWRLLSHLNLNHLSLVDSGEGRAALQEMLGLYDFSDAESGTHLGAVTRQVIDGILEVSSRRVVGRTGSEISSGFCRGVEVSLTLDEQKYVGIGSYLFAAVLERFLGLYVTVNSFSQLVGKTKQGEGYFKKWPPRAGEIQLL